MATATKRPKRDRAPVPTDPEPIPKRRLLRDRTGRRAIIVGLVAFLLAGLSSALGPRTATATARANGYTIIATYPQVTRPGLPIRWEYTVRHPGGFDGPVSLATTLDYLHLFDLTNIEPEPDGATSSGGEVVYRFAPPAGDELRVSMDATAESGFHVVPETTTRVIIGNSTVVTVRFTTRMVP